MIADKIKNIKSSFENDIEKIKNPRQLEDIRIKYLSRNGLVAGLFEELKTVSKEEKPALGKELNSFRSFISEKFNSVKDKIDSNSKSSLDELDLTLPGISKQIGRKHILIQTLDEIRAIFKSMGFSVSEGPEIESDYNNFEALNFPHDHPARDTKGGAYPDGS